MFLTKLLKDERGIGLVEVLASLTISVIVIVSLVSLAIFTLRSSLESKLLLQGSRNANRELELIRAYRDGATEWHNVGNTGFVDLMMTCPNATNGCCINYSGSSLQVVAATNSACTDSVEGVHRYFYATNPDASALTTTSQEVRVSVVVEWTIGGKQKAARLYTDLTNWEGI